jgi:hypothetical protein
VNLVKRWFRPSRPIAGIFLAVILVSSFASKTSSGTSKVSWDITAGWPSHYLEMERYYGPCASAMPCERFTLRRIAVRPLAADALVWYGTAILLAAAVSWARARLHVEARQDSRGRREAKRGGEAIIEKGSARRQ